MASPEIGHLKLRPFPKWVTDQKNIQKLNEEALAKQRPPDFEPPKPHSRMPARGALGLVGVGIIGDEEGDLGGLS
jgi:hypothetical protein